MVKISSKDMIKLSEKGPNYINEYIEVDLDKAK